MQELMVVGTTKLQKQIAVLNTGMRSAKKLTAILQTSPGTARAELVRKILRSVLMLGDRVFLDECYELDRLTLKHVVNAMRAAAELPCEFLMWMNLSGNEFWVRSEPLENDRFPT
jgi:hypothetical protein